MEFNEDYETVAQPIDSEASAAFDELNVEEVFAKGSLRFDEWTLLISTIEKNYPDNLKKISLVYDTFLSEFPLCHGYWKKYAYHKARLCTADEATEIFERAVQSATYCVGVWVDFCNFSMLAFEDPSDIRRVFKRGFGFVGKDYSCHTLWDKYMEFELSQQQLSSLARVYIEALRFPTKKLEHYFRSFKKLVALLEEEIRSHRHSTMNLQSEPLLDEEVPNCSKDADISSIVKDLLYPSTDVSWSKSLQKILHVGERLYQEAKALDEKISSFEVNIRRSYFHVKSLDFDQLENWHHYLDFVEVQGDFDWAVKLYERCLIPCANYPEFWMRYAEFMEGKGAREIANYALDRATQIFLKEIPAMHLFDARFKEHIGDITGAHGALLRCDRDSDSNFTEKVVMRANMERRLGNFEAATNIYEEALEMEAVKDMSNILSVLYVQFSRLKYMITGSTDTARDVLIDGIKRMPCCKLLLEELVKFAIMHGGRHHINVINSIIGRALSPAPDSLRSLNSEDAEDVSRLYLQYVDHCGTIHEVRKAWNQHIRLFPFSLRTALQSSADAKSLKLTKEVRVGTLLAMSQHPLENCSSKLLQEKLSLTVTHDTKCVQDATDQESDQMLPSAKSNVRFEQSTSDTSEPERMKLPYFEVSKETEDTSEPNGSKVVLASPEDDQLSGRENSQVNTSTSDLKCQAAKVTGSSQASREFSHGIHDKQEHEYEQDLKPLSLESLSLNSYCIASADSFPSTPHKCKDPQETRKLNRSILENKHNINQDLSMNSQTCTRAFDSAQNEIGRVSSSTCRSHQNFMPTKRLPHRHLPADSGRNWRRRDNFDIGRRESKFGFRRHSHKRPLQQRQVSPKQNLQSEMGGPSAMNQVTSSQIVPLQSLHIQQDSQSQNPMIAPVAWPVQNIQQPDNAFSSQPQHFSETAAQEMSLSPVQGNGQHDLHCNQAYNQMWQYYYYQQQQFFQQHQLQLQQQQEQQSQLQQEQQPQQQLLLQQYQQQLQFSQYYQQQQQLYQQLQYNQQQQQLYQQLQYNQQQQQLVEEKQQQQQQLVEEKQQQQQQLVEEKQQQQQQLVEEKQQQQQQLVEEKQQQQQQLVEEKQQLQQLVEEKQQQQQKNTPPRAQEWINNYYSRQASAEHNVSSHSDAETGLATVVSEDQAMKHSSGPSGSVAFAALSPHSQEPSCLDQ